MMEYNTDDFEIVLQKIFSLCIWFCVLSFLMKGSLLDMKEIK